MPNVTFGIHKKQVSSPPKVWTRSEIISKSGLGKPLAKASNSSRIRAKGLRNTSQKKCRTSPLESIKNKSLALRLALENRLRKPQTAAGFVPKACETQARKSAPPLESIKNKSLALRLALENRLRKPETAAGFVPKACETQARKSAERHLWNPWKTACESLKQQQDSCQRLAKHKPEKVPNVTFGIHKKQVSIALRLALENRLRKPQTAAGLVPKACETQARKSAERHLWNP